MLKVDINYKSFLRPGNGATDITPLLGDSQAFNSLIDELFALFANLKPEKIACVEGRGFLLGSALAYKFKVGLIPIRTLGKLKNKTYSKTYTDYSNKEKILQIHQDALIKGQKVILVDDWSETGGTLKASINLLELCGAKVIGVGVFMDDSGVALKKDLQKYNYRYVLQIKPGDKF